MSSQPSPALRGSHKSKHVAWRLLMTAHALILREIEESARADGRVPFDWFDVLMAIHDSPDRQLRPSDLADHVLLSRAGMSRRLERMRLAGLIERKPNPDDQRSVLLTLTAKGRRSLFDFWPSYRSAVDRYFCTKLDAEEARGLSEVMHRVLLELGNDRHQSLFPNRVTDQPLP